MIICIKFANLHIQHCVLSVRRMNGWKVKSVSSLKDYSSTGLKPPLETWGQRIGKNILKSSPEATGNIQVVFHKVKCTTSQVENTNAEWLRLPATAKSRTVGGVEQFHQTHIETTPCPRQWLNMIEYEILCFKWPCGDLMYIQLQHHVQPSLEQTEMNI